MATTLASQVQELYVGYLGRAADKAGLDFWVKAIESGTSTLESVALGFTLSEEYKAQYNGLTTTQLVAKVYQNVLGRAADADGLAFWAGEVNKGVIKADTLVKTMIGSLGAIDQLTIDNKVAAANAYTIAAGDKYSVEAGKAAVVNAGSTVPGTSTPGLTFTLTNTADTLTPTSATTATKTSAGDDLIRVVNAGDLATVDYVDAGDGTDTLTVSAGLVAAINPVLKNVEVINVQFAAGGQLNMAGSTGYKELNSKGSTALGAVAGGDFSNIALGTKVGVVDSNVGAVFGFASVTGNADAATLNVADAAALAPVTIAGIETLTVNSTAGSVAAVTANSIALTAAQAETVTVTGDQNLTLTLGANSPSATTIDSSAFSKALTLNFTTTTAATTAGVSIKAGAGADTITLTEVAAGSKVTVDLGAGADTLAIGATAFHKITLGEGADTVNLNAVANAKAIDVSTAAKLAASVIEITDFKSGTDVLNISNGAATGVENTLTGTQLADIASSSNLLTAANAAAALLPNTAAAGNASATVAFQFGSDTYVLVNNGVTADGTAEAIDAADVLIKLTGVTSLVAADITVA